MWLLLINTVLYIFLLFTGTGRYTWQKLSKELERLLDYCEDSNVHVKQSLLMSLLGLSDDKKNTLTRAIKEIFPHSTKKKKLLDVKICILLRVTLLLWYHNAVRLSDYAEIEFVYWPVITLEHCTQHVRGVAGPGGGIPGPVGGGGLHPRKFCIF